jgi:hypothetical protein
MSMGNDTRAHVPPSGRGESAMAPPHWSTIHAAMGNPNPLPSGAMARDDAPRKKRSKT